MQHNPVLNVTAPVLWEACGHLGLQAQATHEFAPRVKEWGFKVR